MRLKRKHPVALIAILSAAVVVTGLAFAQKKATKPLQAPAPAQSYITVSGTTKPLGEDPTQEQNHCFKAAPTSELDLTITSTDAKNHPLPEDGSVTVEILSLGALEQARRRGLSNRDTSPGMEYELTTEVIKNGQAIVKFKADRDRASGMPLSTTIHLGGGPDGMIRTKAGHYSNVALIKILPAGNDVTAAEPVMSVYPYEISEDPIKCTKIR
jgi:hypothetical protein